MKLLYISIIFLIAVTYCQSNDCLSRDYGHGSTVCVCTSDHCDSIPKPERVPETQYLIYTSNKAGLRFLKETSEFTNSTSGNKILIDPDTKYQTILGWGGAFTDATGINIDSLEATLQEVLLKSYFSDDGIEYSLCRVPIGGTDFSTHGYSYDDGDVDTQLSNFSLATEDHKYKIPYITKAKKLNHNLELFASAWTAPKWMKTNGEYADYGFLKQEMFQAWADYFVKFLDSYKNEGVEFWGITTGNEPHTAVPGMKINSVAWNASDMGKWILNNLGPSIRNSNHSTIKLMILDDQRLFIPSFVDEALASQTARDYIDGIAVHWYLDALIPANVLSITQEHFPEKFLLSTEACNLVEPGIGPVVLGSWERGENYSIDIIEDLLNWVCGWVDWNMVLDTEGGPTYIDNNVDAAIIVNATNGELYKQPMFYHLGHFSKFVPKGSVRIDVKSEIDDLSMVAFERPDDGTAVVILNKNDKKVPIFVVDAKRGTAEIEVTEKSITTVLYW